MNKKVLIMSTSLLIAIFLVACGNQGSTQNDNDITLNSTSSQIESSSLETENSKSETYSSQETSSASSESKTSSSQETSSASSESKTSSSQETSSQNAPSAKNENQIQITTESGNIISFILNDSIAANEFYNQLPLEIAVENYASNEKIFYPPNKLNTSDTPMAKGPSGTLAYYAPWDNVAIYYGDCGGASGLYELGNAISGIEHISTMSGTIYISAVVNPLQETARSESSLPEALQEEDVKNIQVTVGNKNFTATLSDNVGANAFVELLKNKPLVINMSDNSGFEKVGMLSTNLPASNSSITATEGDIILYNGNQICVFYASNSWSYTRLAKINDLSGWREALGNGDTTITFSLL